MADFTGRDEETQKRRIEALKGRNVIWITAPVLPGMSESMKKSVEWTLTHGVNLYAVFGSEDDIIHKIMADESRKLYHHAVFADMSDDGTSGGNVVEALKKTGVKFDGCFSPYEQCQTLVGYVAEHLGLPGNPASAYVKARSKHAAREACKAAGVPTPKSMEINEEADCDKASALVGFPMIVKPQMGAGSAGVFKAHNAEDLKERVRGILAEVKESWDLQWNPGLDGVAPVMVEQYLEGDEFDIDILFWEGKCVYRNVVDNWPCIPPYYLECGCNLPSTFPADVQQSLNEYGEAVVKALGFSYGCFHVEVMYTKDGPFLIECNAREGGGPIQEFHDEVYGVDLYANFFMSLCGIPIDPPRSETPKISYGFYFVNCPYTGTLLKNDFLEEARKHPLVTSVEYYCKEGDKVKGLDTQVPDWIGDIQMKGTPEQMAQINTDIQKLVDSMNIKVELEAKPERRKSSVAGAARRMSLKEI